MPQRRSSWAEAPEPSVPLDALLHMLRASAMHEHLVIANGAPAWLPVPDLHDRESCHQQVCHRGVFISHEHLEWVLAIMLDSPAVQEGLALGMADALAEGAITSGGVQVETGQQMFVRTMDGSPAIETGGIDLEISSARLAGFMLVVHEHQGELRLCLYSRAVHDAITSDPDYQPRMLAEARVTSAGFAVLDAHFAR